MMKVATVRPLSEQQHPCFPRGHHTLFLHWPAEESTHAERRAGKSEAVAGATGARCWVAR